MQVNYENTIYHIKSGCLDLSSCGITSIKSIIGLNDLSNLQILRLNDNSISKIEGLDGFLELRDLSLNDNKITEIEGLDSLVELEELNLGNNQIEEIKNLEICKKLKILHLEHNEIKEIKGLETIKELKSLYLNNNQIKEIKNLNSLKKLKELYLNSNKIEKLKNLEHLENLDEILLNSNNFTFPDKIFYDDSYDVKTIVNNCKMITLANIMPFDIFQKYSNLKESITAFKKKIKDTDDKVFIYFGTFSENKERSAMEKCVFWKHSPKIKILQKEKKISESIIIHMIQIHSLKGILPKINDKIEYFNFFINQFWDKTKFEDDYILAYNEKQKKRVSSKIDELLSLSVATSIEKPDIVVFPENSIPYCKIGYLRKFSKLNNIIIIGGLEHCIYLKKYINKAFIIDNGKLLYQWKQTPVKIDDKKKNDALIENIYCRKFPKIKIFKTSIGKIAIFICKDFLRLNNIIPYWVDIFDVDFIVVPSLSNKVLPFHSRLINYTNNIKNSNLKVIFNNIGEYGGSEFFSIKDNMRIENNFRKNNRDNHGEVIVVRNYKKNIFEVISRYLNQLDLEEFNQENFLEKKLFINIIFLQLQTKFNIKINQNIKIENQSVSFLINKNIALNIEFLNEKVDFDVVVSKFNKLIKSSYIEKVILFCIDITENQIFFYYLTLKFDENPHLKLIIKAYPDYPYFIDKKRDKKREFIQTKLVDF